MSASYDAIYNGLILSSSDYHLEKIDLGSPSTKVNKYELARADGQIVTNQNYGERKIIITGSIKCKDLDEMHLKLDALKAKLVGIDANLDIFLGTKNRRYIATVASFEYQTNGYFCTYTINFSANSFGKDMDATTLAFGNYTSSSTTYTNTIVGSYKSKPYIELAVNEALPFWEAKYLQINNAALNQRIRLTKTWGWYDRVIIDGDNKTVSIYPTGITLIDDCDATTAWTSTTATLSLNTTSKLQGTGCIKAVQSPAGSFCGFGRINYATTIDLTSSAGHIIIPIFIPTPSAGAVSNIRFTAGSDATTGTNSLYWNVSTQFDGTALATNAWNYVRVSLNLPATSTTGVPQRASIKSLTVSIQGTSAAMQLNGALLDYFVIMKASIVPQAFDYEGQFPDLNTGSCSLVFSDEFTDRTILATGNYYKRYI